MNYVAYYQQSTQGQSDLGVEAQKTAVTSFVKDSKGIMEEFPKLEYGKNNTWEQLQAAKNNENNRIAAALIQSYRSQCMNWLAMVHELSNTGFKTSKGKSFQAVHVQRIFNSLQSGS